MPPSRRQPTSGQQAGGQSDGFEDGTVAGHQAIAQGDLEDVRRVGHVGVEPYRNAPVGHVANGGYLFGRFQELGVESRLFIIAPAMSL